MQRLSKYNISWYGTSQHNISKFYAVFYINWENNNSTISRAYIDYEKEGQPVQLSLYDNGNGADLVANDGLYSRYFTQYAGVGRYTLKCQVSLNYFNCIRFTDPMNIITETYH